MHQPGPLGENLFQQGRITTARGPTGMRKGVREQWAVTGRGIRLHLPVRLALAAWGAETF